MKHVAKSLVAALALMTPICASAQSAWPTKPITMVVPYAPGGYTDTVGRITARFLEQALGVNVLVENRAGAGGIVGTQAVARAGADGYTLCMCSAGAISIAPLAQKTGYDPLKDLIPISIVSTIPQTVIVNNSLPVKSMDDLVAHAKANPGKITYGSSGTGGLMHYSVALFQLRTGTKMTHVPFKGGAPATAAVVSGEVLISFTNMTDALPQMEAKAVRALAVTSVERSPFTPDLPTVAEASKLNGYSAESWNGVMAPGGTPDAVVKKVSEALEKMAKDEGVQKAMAVAGASTVFTSVTQFRGRIGDEMSQWRDLLKEIKDAN
jgi:tripartite-type tricarboxylate transporter receptor subunit TctC